MINNLRDCDSRVDAMLIDRFKSGDLSAFDPIMARHKKRIYSVAFGILHNHEDAEEVTQDTFVRAFRNLKKFRCEAALSTWLYKIAKNLAINRYFYHRRRGKEVTFSIDGIINDELDVSLVEILQSEEKTPAQGVLIAELSDSIRSCIDKLNEKFQKIIEMRGIEGLSYEEIAFLLEIEMGTVKSRISRARDDLRELVLRKHPELSI